VAEIFAVHKSPIVEVAADLRKSFKHGAAFYAEFAEGRVLQVPGRCYRRFRHAMVGYLVGSVRRALSWYLNGPVQTPFAARVEVRLVPGRSNEH